MRSPIRIIWLRGRGAVFSIGGADYYGWRLGVYVGPLTILIGRCVPAGARDA